MAERRIVRETELGAGSFVRVVLKHGGELPAICVVASGNEGPIWVDERQAEALMHMLADALTVARLGGGA